jgi:2'-5' RNA ligase
MHSVEVVLDDDADGQVRAQWQALLLAGLPSQARHPGRSNRPHITLALTDTISDDVERRLADAASWLPIPVAVGALLIFGARRFVLARLVVPSAGLLDLQAAVVRSLDASPDPYGTFAVGRWTPHVTLARRLTADQVGAALTVLGAAPTLTGQLVRARRWDITAKRETWLS